MRINRVFESDGQAGIARAVSLEQHYSQLGFGVESQVRYHPTDAENGDMNAWLQYVRDATAALAQNPALVALTITNEVNFPTSPNTSDGAYKNALDALVLGIVAARQELTALGRADVSLGFSYAYRYLPSSDDQFWNGIAQRATSAFRELGPRAGSGAGSGVRRRGVPFLPGERLRRRCDLAAAGGRGPCGHGRRPRPPRLGDHGHRACELRRNRNSTRDSDVPAAVEYSFRRLTTIAPAACV